MRLAPLRPDAVVVDTRRWVTPEEKDALEKEMNGTESPAGMSVIFMEPETKIVFFAKQVDAFRYVSTDELTETSRDGDVLTVTIVRDSAGTENPKDVLCTARFEISPRERAVVTKDIVFRNPLYTVTTKDACGITVDIKR